ncbi:MAG: toxin-antitoxin system HicB family antitoxin, partial [Thermodesulfobacteriota bacterium]|nr:toxin-antitoxin system HicB family antitoxin [Thermodesulfobacteriota bacterium]
ELLANNEAFHRMLTEGIKVSYFTYNAFNIISDGLEAKAGALSAGLTGNLMLRINPDIHAAIATISQVQGKSINQWVGEVLDKAVQI